MADLDVNVDYAGNDNAISIINTKGYIDTVTAPELEKRLQELMEQKRYRLVVNLKDVSYISSAGWGIFVSELRDIRENGGDLVLVEMTPDVYDVYELMEFSSILKAFDTMEDALKNFGFNGSIPSAATEDAAAPGAAPRQEAASAGSAADGASMPIQEKLKKVISDNPYFDEKQIRAELNTAKYGNTKLGFFEIKKHLKELSLDDGKKRFEFAMKNK